MQISRMCGVCASAVVLLCVAACSSSITVMQGKNETCPTVRPTRWLFATPPAFADGVVYTSTGYEVVALRASDGALLWQRPDPIGSVALSVDQGILVLANNRQLAGLRTSDGMILWQVDRGTPSPEMAEQGVLAAIDSAGLYAIRLSDGQILWHGAGPFGYVVRLVAEGVVYLQAAVDQTVEAVRLSDGALLWQSTQRAGVKWAGQPLAVVAGRLYVLGPGLLIVRPSDGNPESVQTLAIWGSGTPPVAGAFYGGMIRDGVLYITLTGGPPGTVYALRLADSALLWQAQVDYTTNYVVAVDNGLVFAEGSTLAAARTVDGALQWHYPTDPQTPHYGLELVPAIGAGAVYLAQGGSVVVCTPSQSQASNITGFSEHDGSALWKYSIPSPPA